MNNSVIITNSIIFQMFRYHKIYDISYIAELESVLEQTAIQGILGLYMPYF